MDKIYSYKNETKETFEFNDILKDYSASGDAKTIIIPEVEDGNIGYYETLLLEMIKTVEKGDRIYVDITGMPGPMVIVIMDMIQYGQCQYNTSTDVNYDVMSIRCDGKEYVGLLYTHAIINSCPPDKIFGLIEMFAALN